VIQTGLLTDGRVKLHNAGADHPERPDRIDVVLSRLKQSGLMANLIPVSGRLATDEELERVHPASYIDLVAHEARQGRRQLSTGDTGLCKATPEAARAAAGCAVAAVDAVFGREVHNAFCAIRPPGHHASQSRGMGFCVFNSVAVAARHAQAVYGAEHVAIVDWDVHHGNGTQDIFYSDGSVLFFSSHQSPWYPGTGAASETGAGDGAGKTINCPLPAGSGRSAVLGAFQNRLLPALHSFGPDLILLSAGFDSRIGDPLGGFTLTDEDFGELTMLMVDAAETFCDGRLVSLLEGGYNLPGLALAAEAHVRALARDS